jgi:hypothetical protein
MATRQDIRTVLRKQLGKKVADALLNKVDKMARQGVSADKIERVFLADLGTELEKRMGDLLGTAVRATAVRSFVAVTRGRNVAVRRT